MEEENRGAGYENNNSNEELMQDKQGMVKIDNNPDKLLDFSKIKKSIKRNPWILTSIVLLIILLIVLFKGGMGGGISQEKAGESVVEFLNLRTGGGVEYVSGEDIGNLYEITVSYQGNNLPVFVTKDGEYFVQGAVPISGATAPSEPTPQEPQEVIKSDKPKVELFIMTHCPYGTQAEKGIIPVLELLGDKIDGNIKFVHYFMHDPEETETPIQVCIRDEQSAKYLNYLKCFLEDGDSDRCLTKIGIDTTKLNKCVADKSEEYYADDSSLSEGYGVQGSPSLVINGAMVNSGRDSASYLKTICSAFNEAPEECEGEISSASPSPGFGYEASGTATDATC